MISEYSFFLKEKLSVSILDMMFWYQDSGTHLYRNLILFSYILPHAYFCDARIWVPELSALLKYPHLDTVLRVVRNFEC